MNGNGLASLKAALALSVSAIAAEHFFSAGMSSPWSVAKFAITDQDRAQVWKLFWYGAIASTIFAVIIGAMLNGKRSIIAGVGGSTAIIGFMWYEYRQALSGKL